MITKLSAAKIRNSNVETRMAKTKEDPVCLRFVSDFGHCRFIAEPALKT